jgi:pimeloyl-ACP methyl ester carboxylesterase
VVLVSPVATKVNYLDSRKIGEVLGRLQFFLGKTVPGAGPKLVKSRLISRISTAIILTANQPKLKKQIRDHHFKNLDFISSIDFYYQLHVNINKKGAVDYAPQLNKKFEILIVTGDKDNVTPLATEKKLAAALKKSRLHIIEGVGHLLHYERPTEVAAAINAFLSR